MLNNYVAVYGSYRYWQLLMLPFMEVTVIGNYLCCRLWKLPLLAITYVAVYGSYRYWQSLMLPCLADLIDRARTFLIYYTTVNTIICLYIMYNRV